MRIVIPTYNRVNNQITVSNSKWIQENAEVIIHPDEAGKHKCREIICEDQGKGTHAVRQWILDNIKDDVVIMLDDDLRFYIRKTPDAFNLRYANDEEIAQMMTELHNVLSNGGAPVAGISPRQGNNNYFPADIVYNTRLCHAWGYHRPTVLDAEVRFDRVRFIEDYDFMISMLKRGHRNALLTYCACGQPSSQSPGGLSNLRTVEGHGESVKFLEQLHCPFVKAVEKHNISGPEEYRVRLNPLVYWKKAYAQGVKNALNNR